MKKWVIKEKYTKEFADKLPGYNPVVLQLLYNRDLLTHKQIDEFLNPDFTQDIIDPFTFNEMQKAVDRINLAIKNKEKIFIHADYDADGVTSGTVLKNTLIKVGANKIDVFVPHRDIDGYGLNKVTAKRIIKEKFNLVITVDNGITANEPVKLLEDAGINVIITDHHLPKDDLPKAFATVNANVETEKYPFKKLAGVGVAYKLCQALFASQSNKQDYEAFEKWLLDLVAVGTIGDVVDILGENRTLVKYGLMVLNKTQRIGLQELIRVSSLHNGVSSASDIPLGEELYDLTVRKVAFQIVPRLNAAGRIDHANLAFNLLSTNDEIEAIALAQDIQEMNTRRQKRAEEILNQAKTQIGQVTDKDKMLIAAGKNWETGIVGLVAGRLKDKYSRPVLIFAENKGKFLGSGRSIDDFNLVESLEGCSKYVLRFGGHAQACGLTISGYDNFNSFKKEFKKIAAKKLKDVDLIPSIEIEVELRLQDLDWNFFDELEKFEPFAEGNPQPLFLIKGVKVEQIDVVGKNKTSLRFQISQDDIQKKAISFGTATDWVDQIKKNDIIDTVVEFGVNEWNGNRELQLKIIDFKK